MQAIKLTIHSLSPYAPTEEQVKYFVSPEVARQYAFHYHVKWLKEPRLYQLSDGFCLIGMTDGLRWQAVVMFAETDEAPPKLVITGFNTQPIPIYASEASHE